MIKNKLSLLGFKAGLPEKEIQNQITACLDAYGVFWWRQNNGMAVYQDKNRGERKVRYGTAGASDIGALHKGRFIAIEIKRVKEHEYIKKHYNRILSGNIKSKKDAHISNQIMFIEKVIDRGGIGFFASDVSHVINELESIDILDKKN